ncbi:hypothetical protein F4808DRAFT_383803 [Astrocystis sublimbata]|nr:hypothetical protein F4808DRAFT_383803 [Astrocystis sublimbata]
MLGLLKAAVLLSPAFNLVWAATPEVTSNGNDFTSSSSITLSWASHLSNSGLHQTSLDLHVLESDIACGYGNVTLNGEPLAQDHSGLGSGHILVDDGTVLAADWMFDCVYLEQDPQAQVLSVRINSVDGQEVDGVAFSTEFQQTAPVSISYIDVATAKLEAPSSSGPSDTKRPNLEHELAELEKLKEQLLALESSIASKITHISDTFNLDNPKELLQVADCEDLSCIFNTAYDRVKALADKLYRGGKIEGSASSRPGFVDWSSRHGGQHPLAETGSTKSHDATEDSSSAADDDGKLPDKHQRPFADVINHVLNVWDVVIVGLVVLISITLMVLMVQCVSLLRQRRQARWERRRSKLRQSRENCNALAATKYVDLIRWLRESLHREGSEDEEKAAIANELHQSDDDETLSITMEEEIAQFRAAARAVGNLVSTEQGRGRSRLAEHLSLNRPRRASTPSSIISSCPTYRSVDESLPAYDEHCSPEYVVDELHRHQEDLSSLGGNVEKKE